MTLSDQIKEVLISDIKRRLVEESMPRIRKCLDELNEEEIWYRPNENTVSVGNLLLHLNGNITQWILSGIGDFLDNRDRDAEFITERTASGDELYSMLEKTMEKVVKILDEITPQDLTKSKKVQGFNENTISILVHVTEHFSYHVGQITYYVKTKKNVDTEYYNGLDLNKK